MVLKTIQIKYQLYNILYQKIEVKVNIGVFIIIVQFLYRNIRTHYFKTNTFLITEYKTFYII